MNIKQCIPILLLATLCCSSLPAQIADQASAPVIGPSHGKRAFVKRRLQVPINIGSPESGEREVPLGTVVKLVSVDARHVAFDDFGAFSVRDEEISVLSNDLDACIEDLGAIGEFDIAFAKGNYLLNVNLADARAAFETAEKIDPANANVQLGLALAQSALPAKRRMLSKVSDANKIARLLAETHLAKMDRDFKEMERISRISLAPGLVTEEMLSHIVMAEPSLATESMIIGLLDNWQPRMSAPARFSNLQAMLFRRGLPRVSEPMSGQDTFSAIMLCTGAAKTADPYFYHVHMTLGEYAFALGNYQVAAQEYEHALRLHPTLIAALAGYVDAIEMIRKKGQQLPAGTLGDTFEMRTVMMQLVAAENSDLLEESSRVRELMVHGFLPVNHGGRQPKKMEVLRERNAQEAIAYLKHQFQLDRE
jgi:tetratricopeptide (TPR) repeat protein